MSKSPLAGKLLEHTALVNVPRLVTAYYATQPDPKDPAQRVAFGTSGHRGSALTGSFNEQHIAAVTQAICQHRAAQGINGPLFIGVDTHALSEPALVTALEVLAANDVQVRLATGDEYTPTPALSHAILTYNRGRSSGLADGIVITPSHNPPRDGGFKYNPPNGGPADTAITGWVEQRANEFLEAGLAGVRRVPLARALASAHVQRHDFLGAYVDDLRNVIDFDVIAGSSLKLGVDPLGGASVHFWGRIAERYRLDLTVVNAQVDPTFRFMTADWDGELRMDPSSADAMRPLLALKDRFDVAFACDTDADRHGIVARSVGLLPPNHYLCVAIDYLLQHRPAWSPKAGIGKTVVSSSLIDRVAARRGRAVYEVPVGFKWFVDGLVQGTLAFGGEESAGASFSRRDGQVWTTDKDGLIAALLSAELTARTGKDPGVHYRELTQALGEPVAARLEAKATPQQKAVLKKLSASQVKSTELAGEKIEQVLTTAPGNGAALGGLKVVTAGGWFAARPSGTEDIYKVYVESFRGQAHLERIATEAQALVASVLGG